MKRTLYHVVLLTLVCAPLLAVQFLSSGDQGGPGSMRGYTNYWQTGWPFASIIHSETIHNATGAVTRHSPREYSEPRFANRLVCSILGGLPYAGLAFVLFPKFPRYTISDLMIIVTAAALTATYFNYEIEIFWPTFSWQNFEFSSFHWPIIIRPFWMNAGIAIYLSIAITGVLSLLLTPFRSTTNAG